MGSYKPPTLEQHDKERIGCAPPRSEAPEYQDGRIEDQEAPLQHVLHAPAGLELVPLPGGEAVVPGLQRHNLGTFCAEADPEVQDRLHHALEDRQLVAPPVHVVEPVRGRERRVGTFGHLLQADNEAPHHLIEDLLALRGGHYADGADVLRLHLLRRVLLVQEVEDAQADVPELVADELRGRAAVEQAPGTRPLHAPLHDLVILGPAQVLPGHVGKLAADLGPGQAHVPGVRPRAVARDGAAGPVALVGAIGHHDLPLLLGFQDLLPYQAVLVRREEVQGLPQLLGLASWIPARLMEAQVLQRGLDVLKLHEGHLHSPGPTLLLIRRLFGFGARQNPGTHAREQCRKDLRGVAVHALAHDPAKQVLANAQVQCAPVVAVHQLPLAAAVPRLRLDQLLLRGVACRGAGLVPVPALPALMH
mmetsp:Transcript_156676/g.380540  ORF Transcript_156676/g.380540 Transcript_156676/m.380540 type:complete len:419 (-) Transcript_156676:498-1754(-)